LKEDVIRILCSWSESESDLYPTSELLEWINERNNRIKVKICESSLGPEDYWFFDEKSGVIENRNKKFFSISGIKHYINETVVSEQPIIIQPEIGFLGIICREFNGVMHFLMQAKVEPGNVNHVQISPTTQATRSNFDRVHGGREPHYFQYFKNSKKYKPIFDQVQSEQGTRFYKKRNRNIMIRVDEDIEVLPGFHWMTLGQIKQLMKIDNLVNMDTRTVLACIPFSTYRYDDSELGIIRSRFGDESLFNSLFMENIQDSIATVYNHLNNVKMFTSIHSELVPLRALRNWKCSNAGIFCLENASFDVKFFDIEIYGREVQHWKQPMFCSKGIGLFGLFAAKHNNVTMFLISVRAEVGTFDTIEIGPTISIESSQDFPDDKVTKKFLDMLEAKKGIIKDSVFSEEGGRFYHEQNRNVIIETDYIAPQELPDGFFWMSYSSLNCLVQINNCLTIQLRNLLSTLDI
jgi:oxidase EvaA